MKSKNLHTFFEAMYHSKYNVEEFLFGDIQKEYSAFEVKGKTIYKASTKLKDFHKFLSLFVFEHFRTNDSVVFSFRKGNNVFNAVEMHAKNKFFLSTDIQNFFPSITKENVRELISRNIDSCPIIDIENYIDRIIELVVIDNQLPIGFSTSPVISNSIMYEFDNEFYDYCNENNLTYSRYADDIIISSSQEINSNKIEVIQSYLDKHSIAKLRINHKKTKINHLGRKVKILGLVILPNGKVTVDSKYKNDLETLLHFYTKDKDKFIDKADGNLANGINLVKGYINYINSVDPDYIHKLRRKYGTTLIDIFVHKTNL
ncbi:reverse transcriptase domain-containing protein [Vibrio parahaemolyticus]|uniref:reverse transcriptase domain-containing protein n=1 Tax=Vibrio parahaemolyticus TaxID=670 RepID=UPI00235EC13D|nr:reverse transcriptase domain-containing protein [Vibrio parahaemolyticus]